MPSEFHYRWLTEQTDDILFAMVVKTFLFRFLFSNKWVQNVYYLSVKTLILECQLSSPFHILNLNC